MKTALLLLLGGFLCGLHGAEGQDTPDLLSMITKLQSRVQDLENQDQALKNKIQALEISQAQLQTGSPVAFYVHFTVTDFTLKLNEPIKYDQVLTNVGGAYSTDTGNFTAPLKGLYVFSFFVFTTGNTELIHLRLKINNRSLAYVYGQTTPGIQDSSTGVAVVTLEAGDTVYVTPADQRSSSGHKKFQTNFCGFLLSPM